MIHNSVCDLLSIDYPVVLAGMGGATNAELVAAVSEAGGLGILACTWRSADDAVHEIQRIRSLTNRPFGVNFVLHQMQQDTFRACLAEHVPVFSFFRGDPTEAVQRAHAVGAVTIDQITSVQEAKQAVTIGVDVLIAQGCEAGGHMGPLPLWSLLPEVINVAGSRPVLAAGGLVDGKDLAAALSFGAVGIVMGTRFIATPESSARNGHKQAILDSQLGDTVATAIWDILQGVEWPGGIKVRSLRNRMTERWAGREQEMGPELESLRAASAVAEKVGDLAFLPLLAGVGSARIHELKPAGQIVRDVISEAEQILRYLNG